MSMNFITRWFLKRALVKLEPGEEKKLDWFGGSRLKASRFQDGGFKYTFYKKGVENGKEYWFYTTYVTGEDLDLTNAQIDRTGKFPGSFMN